MTDRQIRRKISANIRTQREAAEMSQGEIAKAAPLAQGYVSLLEAGERLPTLSALNMLAKAMGCELGDLLAGLPTSRNRA